MVVSRLSVVQKLGPGGRVGPPMVFRVGSPPAWIVLALRGQPGRVMIAYHFNAQRRSDTLIVAFTGVAHRLGEIPFEFYRSLQDAPTLFVSDLAQAWYQADTLEILDRITAAMSEIGASHIACLGNSMGGFGALLFGSLANASSVLAFVPQTAISPQVTETLGDFRYSAFQDRIASYPYGDLNALPPASHVTLCYGDEDQDVAHIRRLAWPARHIVCPGSGHNPAAALKEQGRLLPIIREALLPVPAEAQA